MISKPMPSRILIRNFKEKYEEVGHFLNFMLGKRKKEISKKENLTKLEVISENWMI